MSWLGDPGPCPVCGMPHTTCVAPTGSIVVDQLSPHTSTSVRVPAVPLLQAEIIQATLTTT
jgi:hypothetical protein